MPRPAHDGSNHKPPGIPPPPYRAAGACQRRCPPAQARYVPRAPCTKLTGGEGQRLPLRPQIVTTKEVDSLPPYYHSGVARDTAEAERWIEASAAQGFYRALENMGLVCERRGDDAAALR